MAPKYAMAIGRVRDKGFRVTKHKVIVLKEMQGARGKSCLVVSIIFVNDSSPFAPPSLHRRRWSRLDGRGCNTNTSNSFARWCVKSPASRLTRSAASSCWRSPRTKDVSSSPRSVWELTSAERESAKKCKRFFKRKGKRPALSSKEVKRNVVDSLFIIQWNVIHRNVTHRNVSGFGRWKPPFFAPCFD